MVIHYTNIYNNVVFPDKKACIFRFKGRKSGANGDSVTLEFMIMCGKHKSFRFPRTSSRMTYLNNLKMQRLRSLFQFSHVSHQVAGSSEPGLGLCLGWYGHLMVLYKNTYITD